MKTILEFQYFDGCPNSAESLKNLYELIDEGIISKDDVVITNVPDMDSAEQHNFQGSPSILINGVDIFTGRKPTGFTYACRVYDFDGRKTGVIPKAFIKEKLK